MTKIAFLGAGTMGSAMIPNLLRAGHDVTVYNRTLERARPLEGLGAKLAATPREAVNGAEGRARGEESFRRRAEQGECLGWPPMTPDDTPMAPDCELVLFLMTH